MTRTTLDLRAALQRLADQAPTVEQLDQRPWRRSLPPRGRRRSAGVVALVVSAAAIVVVLAAVGFAVFGRDHAAPQAGGSHAALEARPLVAPAVVVGSGGRPLADPLRTLPFAAPGTTAQYQRLTPVQRHQLAVALARTDCAAQVGSDEPVRVACTAPAGGRPTALLLGPSIFDDGGLLHVRAVEPSALGTAEWSVSITLDRAASRAWTRYTTAHHSADAGSADPRRCGRVVPCADYVAFVVDGEALSVPTTLGPLGAQTSINGNFSERTAKRLARELDH